MTTSRKEKILEDTQTHTGALESLISAAQKLPLHAKKLRRSICFHSRHRGESKPANIVSGCQQDRCVYSVRSGDVLLQAASWRRSQMLLRNRAGNLLPDPSMQQKGEGEKKNVCVCFFKQGCGDSALRQPAVRSRTQAKQQTGQAVWLDDD